LFFIAYVNEFFGGEPLLSIAAAVLLVALPFLLFARPEAEGRAQQLPEKTAAGLLAGAATVSLAAAYARSVLVVPMLVPKVTIAFLPVLLVLIAVAVSKIRPKWFGSVVAGALVLGSLTAVVTSGYYVEPIKEQWREAVGAVLADPAFDSAADVVLGVSSPGFQYYVDQNGVPVTIEEATPEKLAELVAHRAELPRVWVLVARDEDVVRDLRSTLRDRWVRVGRWDFFQTSVERWEPIQTDEGGPAPGGTEDR
jgi:hypothetical protein